jgi:hypothetical protein
VTAAESAVLRRSQLRHHAIKKSNPKRLPVSYVRITGAQGAICQDLLLFRSQARGFGTSTLRLHLSLIRSMIYSVVSRAEYKLCQLYTLGPL